MTKTRSRLARFSTATALLASAGTLLVTGSAFGQSDWDDGSWRTKGGDINCATQQRVENDGQTMRVRLSDCSHRLRDGMRLKIAVGASLDNPLGVDGSARIVNNQAVFSKTDLDEIGFDPDDYYFYIDCMCVNLENR